MLKKRLILFVSLFLVAVMFLAIGCGSSQPAPQPKEKTALEKIKEAGVITVGNSPDYPPFETVDDNGNPIGFDIDLMNAIAAELGVKAEFKKMDFAVIITAVQNSQLDIGMSGFSISEDRKKEVDFSIPYFLGGQTIVVAPNSNIKKIEDLNGQVVAVQMGTTCADVAKENIEGAKIRELDDFNTAFMMLKNGSAKAVVADLAVANEYIKKEGFTALGEPLNYEENAIVVKKGNPDLVDALNKALTKLKDNGTITELAKKWKMQ